MWYVSPVYRTHLFKTYACKLHLFDATNAHRVINIKGKFQNKPIILTAGEQHFVSDDSEAGAATKRNARRKTTHCDALRHALS